MRLRATSRTPPTRLDPAFGDEGASLVPPRRRLQALAQGADARALGIVRPTEASLVAGKDPDAAELLRLVQQAIRVPGPGSPSQSRDVPRKPYRYLHLGAYRYWVTSAGWREGLPGVTMLNRQRESSV